MPSEPTGIEFPPSVSGKGMYLVLDVEATGLPIKSIAEAGDYDNWPRILQIGWLLFDENGGLIRSQNRYFNHGIMIPGTSTRIHGIDAGLIEKHGEMPEVILSDFLKDLKAAQYIVGHNVDFDLSLLESELHRCAKFNPFAGKYKFCTMCFGRGICNIPAPNGQGYKYPSLEELYLHSCSSQRRPVKVNDLHNAFSDAGYTAAIFFDLLNQSKTILHHSQRIPYRFPDVQKPRKANVSSLLVKVALPSLLIFILIVLLAFVVVMPRFRNNIMTEKRLMIKELTNTAWSILAKYHKDQSYGLLTPAQAKLRASGEIKNLRYGSELKDYFWITDMSPVMIMHPYRPDLDGEDVGTFSDPKGKRLFVEFVNLVKSDNQGYVEYQWQWKDDSTLIVPKLSFVKLFEPWGWIIGTGIYLDDVDKEISALSMRLWIISAIITLVIACLLSLILLQSLRIERRRQDAEQKLSLSREKYRTLVESASDGMLMIMDQRIVFANKVMEDLTGFTTDELIDQPSSLLFEGNPDLEISIRNNESLNGLVEADILSINRQPRQVYVSMHQIQLNTKTGVIVSIHNNRMMQSFENQTLELIKKLQIGYFTATLGKEMLITRANENVLHIFGIPGLDQLKSLDLLTMISDADTVRELLRSEREMLNRDLVLRKPDMSTKHVRMSLLLIDDKNCQGLVEDATEDSGRQEALVLYQQLSQQYLAPLEAMIQKANSTEDLKEAFLLMHTLAGPLVDARVNSRHITRMLSDTADQITQRLIEMGLNHLGPAPASFQFICMGSQARKEMTLATDQDNAILFDLGENAVFDQIQSYFLQLGTFVCDGLNDVGYSWCKGRVMAKNPQWCTSVQQWHKMISTWISHSSPEHLLSSSILFDLRVLFASPGLEHNLYDHIFKEFSRNELYFVHMAKSLASSSFVPSRLNSMPTLSLKKCLMPVTAGIRLYSLNHNVEQVNTYERANRLLDAGYLSEERFTELGNLLNHLSSLRLQHQIDQWMRGKTPDNEMPVEELDEFNLIILKWDFRVIESWQAQVRTDFAALVD